MEPVVLMERLSKDSSVKSFDDVGNQLQYFEVETDRMIQRVTELMQIRAMVDNAIAQYTGDAHYELLQNQEVKGFKLKKGRITRKIVSQEKATQVMNQHGFDNDKLFETKLIGIPALEKLLHTTNMSKEDVSEVVDSFVQSTQGEYKTVIA